jgi:hypothetical protein
VEEVTKIINENSGTMKNEILIFLTTWMYQEDIMLNDISQAQKNK